MIRQANEIDFLHIKGADPFLTRILSLYQCYGEGYDFVSFWVQDTAVPCAALVSRFEDKFSLYLTHDADPDEIAAFVQFQGAGSCLFNAAYALPLDGVRHAISGQVLVYEGEDVMIQGAVTDPDFRQLYELISSCGSDTFIVPPYLMFVSDLTRRRNSGKLSAAAFEEGGRLISCALTVSQTDSAAILGAVATHPDCRRRGLSRRLVRGLATCLRAQRKRVYVLSAVPANTQFYQRSGFGVTADFQELFL